MQTLRSFPSTAGCIMTASLASLLLLPVSLSTLRSLPGTAHCTHCTHCTRCTTPTAALLSPPGIIGLNLAGSLTHDACACDASLGPPSLRKCSRPFSHPRVLLQRAGHYNRIQLPSQSIPHWFQPLLGYRFPQTMRLCYNFRLAGALGIKLWTTKAVYGRTEEFELHNRQLPCPLSPPSPSFNLWSVCRWVRLDAD